MRTYLLKPGTTAAFEERFVEGLGARQQFSKLGGLWRSEVGGLNVVVHMWPYESFRDFAHWIALAFRLALEESNPGKIDLPIAPLTAKVCEVITGEKLKASIVGQHLRQPYRKKRSQTRHPGA